VNYEYKLDIRVDFSPNLQERTTKAYSFNIMEMLSEQILNVDPTLFLKKTDVRYADVNRERRFYEDFGTSNIS
jgi:hypothetical protein